MKHKTTLNLLLSLALGIGLSFTASAHRAWILPSTTILSGEAPWVTFDAAISNTLFVPEHFPLGLGGVDVLSPQGNKLAMHNASKGKYRSTFDLELTEQGTYKIAMAGGGLRALWEDQQGNRKMWPGRGQTARDEEFASAVPKDAKNLRVSRSYRRVETFVTAGALSDKVFAPTKQGLELVPITHPNDLYVGENARFQLLFEGKPAVGAEVALVRGAMRYRNQQDIIKLVADAEGKISLTWADAGQYLLEAEYQDDQAQAPASTRQGSYSATLEVLPL